MEALPERGGDTQTDLAESRRQLQTSANKLERISQHTKGLFGEITDWVDLRVKLVQVDLQEKFEEKKIQIGLGVGMALVAFFAVLFLLTTIALALGAWLGHPVWGFLIVTILLFVTIAIMRLVMKRMLGKIEKKVSVEEAKLAHHGPAPQQERGSANR